MPLLLRQSAARLRESQAGAFHDAPNASGGSALVAALRRAGLVVLCSVFLAFSGAFGTGPAPLFRRVVFWLAVIGGGMLVGVAVERLLDRWEWASNHPWRAGVLHTLLVAAPVLLLVWAMLLVVFGLLLPAAGMVQLVLPVLTVTACMVLLTTITDRQPLTTHAAPPLPSVQPDAAVVPVAPAAPRFAERLPPRLRGATLHAVQAEDHYLRLHTSRGSDLVLLRLADALAELDGIEGAQVHRSWWVARAAVQGATRSDGKLSLTLPDGLAAPVSRTYIKALREDGWF